MSKPNLAFKRDAYRRPLILRWATMKNIFSTFLVLILLVDVTAMAYEPAAAAPPRFKKSLKSKMAIEEAPFDIPQYDRLKNEPHDDRRIVGMECHKKNNTLEVGYYTDYNLPKKLLDLWDTFDLKRNRTNGDQEYVESIYAIVRKCNLGNDHYIVKIRPVPGNWNLNGQCGGATYGGVEILKNGIQIYDGNFEECDSKEIVAKVKIFNDQTSPLITKMSHKEYYGF
jgi:hypothetical protein